MYSEEKNNEEYRAMHDFVSSLKLTNDTAERGVQLVQQSVRTITREEKDMQWLLQCVEAHRKRFTTFRKSTLNNQYLAVGREGGHRRKERRG